MSVFDQQLSSTTGCFGFGYSSEDPDYVSLTQQMNRRQDTTLSREDEKKKKEVDDLLSDAMNELTFEERQRQQEVLHGVDEKIAEEATFIHSTLHELDNHLVRIKRGSAYEMAERMDAAYVSAWPFRVMFLRSNQYDTRATADQLLRFFEVKKKLFGAEKMVKDITLEDLNEDDRTSLSSGWLQLLGKDRSNRVVCCQFPGHRTFKDLRNELRAKFYFMMTLLKNKETQLRGVVHVLYAIEEFKDRTNGMGFVENVQVALAIPVHNASVHLCSSDVGQYATCYMAVKVMPAKLRSRLKVHFGSHLECQYRLSTYGISMQLHSSGQMMNMDHRKQLFPQAMPVTSIGSQSSSLITQPSANDVIYTGAGKSNNAGNQHLRTLVLKYSPAYDAGNNETKRNGINAIIDEIERNGGRFLQYANEEESVWGPVPKEEVRLKIAQMFRNRRRRR
ncbi:unnamed protein product [Cylindrotheca closterium]|uniref:DUF6824 domain-containing protein n=1 Tax=Cylindrotheca closterium TaxID=2856 RepID=A0AAD2JH17_9STRA|nr:unnamed protein product [Cylindrotheca closterium]